MIYAKKFFLLLILSFLFSHPVLADTSQSTASISEIEPNNDSTAAQNLPSIGALNYVTASITTGDRDWYRFSGQATQTYVIELFDVGASVNNFNGSNCSGYSDEGLGIILYDASITRLTRSCEPNDDDSGSGNTHNRLQVTTGVDGDLLIQIVPNHSSITGSYKLRVLPQYDSPNATWDNTTHEPNNVRMNATPINIGLSNSIESTIEPRIANYATNDVDRDWFHFNATADTTYVIELFNVDANFNAASGSKCNGYSDEGIGLKIVDDSGTVIAYECEPNDGRDGAGNSHSVLSFTPGLSGDYFLMVIPNNSTRSGTYHLRVLPQYDDNTAEWQTNFEPNNHIMNAAEVGIGRNHAITAAIEARTTNYATNMTDYDWYRFEAVAGKAYTLELFNVDSNFNAASGSNCNGYSDEGLGMRLYDPSRTQISSVCEPNDGKHGSGDVHNILTITPGISGTYFVLIMPNSSTRSGNYSLRVLPDYNDPVSSWDSNYEPNNRLNRAAKLEIGRTNAIRAAVEDQTINYATNFVDVDWYYFRGEANASYLLELYDVDSNFNAASGANCNGYSDEGLGIVIYDSSGTRLTYACEPNNKQLGSGNVLSSLQFDPGVTADYFIKIISNSSSRNGQYSLRVLPHFSDSMASWDANAEPNNTPMRAALLTPNQPIITDIESRSSNLSTNFVDRDWYRIEAIAGETYVVETVNVAASLTTANGSLCQGSRRTGLGIRVVDPTLSTTIARQCSANGEGAIHTQVEFTAATTGTYYVWVLPNTSSVSGTYTLRLNGQHQVFVPIIIR